MNKLNSLLPREAWFVAGKPILSLRRLLSLAYYRIKRKLGFDYSFSPPDKSNIPIDIFIPTIEKDAKMLDIALEYAKKNILHPIKNIYIIAPPNSKKLQATAKKHKATFIDETKVLDLKKDEIDYKVGTLNRNGWIYKMLINLSADTVSKSRYILILDADTCFIAPQIFVYKERPLFNLSNEYNQAYFDATERVIGLKHKPSRSFITHYMLFDAEALRKLRAAIEEKWQKPWYKAIIDSIDKKERSGFADYEIYGDFYMDSMPKKPILNYWSNESLTIDSLADINAKIKSLSSSFRSVSFHNYQDELRD